MTPMTMPTTTNRESGLPRLPDPFSLARSIFGFDPFFDERRLNRAAFVPAFEVKESADAYVINADVPGIKESDIDLSIKGNVLTISGTRNAEERQEGETFYLYERSYGSFSRSFTLPDEANPESVNARLDQGVLTVTIGKKPASQPRKISLNH
jgi:HSP20 family protein